MTKTTKNKPTQLPDDERMAHPPALWTDAPKAMTGWEVLQFGNKKNPSGLYADWYKAKGVTEVVSIDWNGKDGALNLDCNFPLDISNRGEPFDLVTNFGFSEHVTNQPAFWENNHSMCKVDGYMIGVTPAPGFWPHHGILQPSKEFYRMLAEANGYRIEALWINTDRERHTVCYTFQKVYDKPFLMPHAWEQWIIPTEEPSKAALRHSRVK